MMDYGPARLRPVKRRRASSYDRTGGNCDHWRLHPGEEKTLLDISGPGCLRHLWFTIGSADPLHLRNLVLRAFWDGEKTPSILCPLGDFFGLGHGRYTDWETPWLAASAQGGRALNCFFPMPFSQGARLTVENQGKVSPPAYLYFYLDYETGMAPPPDVGRFHAHWRRECLPSPDRDLANRSGQGNFRVADLTGRGQYVGTILFVDSPSPVWYGEGDDLFFVDGEKWPPALHGTGTEDYFNTAWCPRQKSIGPHHGVIMTGQIPGGNFLGKHTLYRFHAADPVTYAKSLRFSLEHGTGNEFTGDWAATSFWYGLDRKKPLPPLPPPAERKPLPDLTAAAGRVLEQRHKSLSYFFQTGAAALGQKLIAELKKAWQQGKLDEQKAKAWASRVKAQLAVTRMQYLKKTRRCVVLPYLKPADKKQKFPGLELAVDGLHGSWLKAPLPGRMYLGYDEQYLYVAGEFDLEEKARPGFDYDRIDLMLALEKWEEEFIQLNVSPTFKYVEALRHEPQPDSAWDDLTPLAKVKIPVKTGVSGSSWHFRYRVPWKDLGLAAPVPGAKLHLNIDRWNQYPRAWWASWALTPHHYYPPQMAGIVEFGE